MLFCVAFGGSKQFALSQFWPQERLPVSWISSGRNKSQIVSVVRPTTPIHQKTHRTEGIQHDSIFTEGR